MLEAAVSAAEQLFAPGPLLAMLLVLPVALLSGLMPGGGLPVLIVVLSLAVHLDPWVAITAVVFYLAANDITEPIPAILLGVPGARSAQATVLDGYPMAQKGLASVALGASYTTTIVGGVIGAVALLLSLPVSRKLLQLFGSAEFFLLALMGVMAVAVVSAGAFVKGMLTAALGIAVAMIGFTDLGGVLRATFGLDFYLWDGIGIVPIVVGLFALPEAFALVVGDTTIARERLDVLLQESRSDVWRGMREAWRHKWLMTRSSLIGVFVGMMPGVGGSAAHWIAYAQARQTEEGGIETFGKGDIRGVIASDAANNSVDGGVLIPTVVFGIPGSGGMAIVLAILALIGISPGPGMLTRHLDLTIGMVYTIVLGNLIVVPIMFLFASWLCRIAVIPANILAPIVIGIVSLSALATNASLSDLVGVLVFGVLGIFMKLYGWPRPPILIAVVLADVLERFLWISINNYGLAMLARPQFLTILVLMIVATAFGLHAQRGARLAMESSRVEPDTVAARTGGRSVHSSSIEFVGEAILLLVVGAFFIYLFVDSWSWPLDAALMPRIAVILGFPFWLMRAITLLRFQGSKGGGGSEIMDTGFILGIDPKAESQRFARIIGFTLLLYGGIWLIGIHITLPVTMFLYLLIYGRAGWMWSAATAFVFLGLIVGFYDWVLAIVWPDPVLPLF